MTELTDLAVELFCELCELQPEEQERRLAVIGVQNPVLRTRVARMLIDDRSPDQRLDAQTFDLLGRAVVKAQTAALPPDEIAPRRIGDYTLLRRLGGGGMGVVYEAEQDEPRRRVALKILRSDLISSDRLERSTREARVLAHLKHPGIAQVLAAGSAPLDGDPDGEPQPFIAMELVEGFPVDVFVRERDLPTTERLELFIRACDAVHHAHEQGVVHRDLKPANILVDEAHRPKILDFGVARITGVDLSVATFQVGTGQIVGTLPYMSPEQADGGFDELDAVSDVYSLGVILYELLTGRPPYAVRGKPIHEAIRVIREDAPASLSNRELERDLETVVLKALEKERGRRYSSASRLAEDLGRFLRREPVEARRPTLAYRARRFAARNRALCVSVGLVGVILAASALGLSKATLEAREKSEIASRLQDLQGRRQLTLEAQSLWPAREHLIGRYRDWLERAGALSNRSATHAEFEALIEEVAQRLRRAESIRAETVEAFEVRWNEAIRSISYPFESPIYNGLQIEPQVGLVPLGKNRATGLWEFAHVESGSIPDFDEERGALVDPSSGLVFVLLPGSAFSIGAQNHDPEGEHYDPEANRIEGPPSPLLLMPYFISKFEMSREQWKRITGEDPSYYARSRFPEEAAYPVENVSWDEARECLRRVELELPSEAQWEFAARAGTDTRWWTGNDERSLRGAANLADSRSAEPSPNGLWPTEAWLDDGFPIQASVDSLLPNPFGLHHVHGNVAEWCLDKRPHYGRERTSPSGNGLMITQRDRGIVRGGSFAQLAREARSTARRIMVLGSRSDDVGIRPVRRIDP